MKKLWCLILALVLVFALASCNDGEGGDDPKKPGGGQTIVFPPIPMEVVGN